MEAARQRALVRATAVNKTKKEKDKASSSTPKDVTKGVPKRKSEGKDDRPLKKGIGITIGDVKQKKLSPPKPTHGAGKGLMKGTSPVSEGTPLLLTHKGYTVEMVESIIKETDVEPCAEHATEDLGAPGLFKLLRVCFS